MAGENDLHRSIGQLEGRVSSLETMFMQERLHNREWQARMEAKMDSLHSIVASAKGGAKAVGLSWRVAAGIITLAIAIGGLIVSLAQGPMG